LVVRIPQATGVVLQMVANKILSALHGLPAAVIW
jgi:hypothetical protein